MGGRASFLGFKLPFKENGLTIGAINKNKELDHFEFSNSYPDKGVSEDQVKAYLSKVSEYLGFGQQSEATA